MHKYYYRKAYNSGEALIEFVKGTESDGIFSNVFSALSSVHPSISNICELWKNNEMIVDVNSDLGHFLLQKDVNNHSRIVFRRNAGSIDKIDQLLAASPMFMRAS
jgi:hypothetical protein